MDSIPYQIPQQVFSIELVFQQDLHQTNLEKKNDNRNNQDIKACSLVIVSYGNTVQKIKNV